MSFDNVVNTTNNEGLKKELLLHSRQKLVKDATTLLTAVQHLSSGPFHVISTLQKKEKLELLENIE